MKKHYPIVIGLVAIIIALLLILYAPNIQSNTSNTNDQADVCPIDTSAKNNLYPEKFNTNIRDNKYLKEIKQAYRILQKHPYENRDEISKKMVEAAIKAMALQVDDHTQVLTKETTKDFQSSYNKGSFGGIGALIRQKASWQIENISDLNKLADDLDLSKIAPEELQSVSHFEELLLKLGNKIQNISIVDSEGKGIDKNMPFAMYKADSGSKIYINIKIEETRFIIIASKHLEYVHIVKPIKGGPAEMAGIKADDIILGVKKTRNDRFESFNNKDINYVLKKLRGLIGTEIIIQIRRDDKILEIPIIRDNIKLSIMETNRFGDIGYIKLNNFTRGVSMEFKEKLQELSDTEGLVIDLRDNSGGLLNETITMVDYLLPKGKEILSLKDKDRKKKFSPTKRYSLYKKPIIIFVNNDSASASEVLTGILKHHKRALVIGENTFGKGSVQQLYKFSNGQSLKYTVAEYFILGSDGKEHKIDGIGIKPDIEIDTKLSIEEILELPEIKAYLNQ